MRRESPWKSSVFRTLFGVLYGMLWMAGGLLLLSGLLLLGNVSEQFLMIAADVLWCIGALIAGHRSGYHARLHGIRTGMLCGTLMCGVLLAGCVWMQYEIALHLWIRCALLLLSSVIGGIWGVNTKITKPPY